MKTIDLNGKRYEVTRNGDIYEYGPHGKKVGNIIDVMINSDGKMKGLVVEKSKFLISMFSNKDEIVIDGTDNVKYVPLCGECYLKNVKKITKDMEKDESLKYNVEGLINDIKGEIN